MDFLPAKTILSGYAENNHWFGNNYNMNLYKGCCHSCIYCDSRSDCYRVENFDTIRAKADAIGLLERELQSKRKKGVIGTGAMSDPYNPFEEKLQLTRQSLMLIEKYRFGSSIVTKSNLITRDIDLFQEIKKHAPVLCKLTITAIDDNLCGKIEPNVSRSSERFVALKALSDAGIFTGVLLMPVLPFLTDTIENMLGIVRQAAFCGAKFVFPSFGVTLRANQREYFYQRLEEQFPGLKQNYIRLFGENYNCTSAHAKELYPLFQKECKKYGLLYQMEDIIRAYQSGYEERQLSLF